MSYSQSDIDNFWWGKNGSAESPQPGAYVLMNGNTVVQLTSRGAGYDAAFSAILGYLQRQAANGTGIGPTGSDGFTSKSRIGSEPITTYGGAKGQGWNGPTKS